MLLFHFLFVVVVVVVVVVVAVIAWGIYRVFVEHNLVSDSCDGRCHCSVLCCPMAYPAGAP